MSITYSKYHPHVFSTCLMWCIYNAELDLQRRILNRSMNKRTLTHKHTNLYSAVNPFGRGKHEITVDTLDRKQRNVWEWLTKMKMKRGSTHTLFYHQQEKPLQAPIRPDYTPSTGRLPSRHENTPVNHAQDPKLSQACITEHKSTWRKGRGFTAQLCL